MIRIAIADDHALVRAGLRQFLADQSDMAVVAEAGTGRQALDIVRARDRIVPPASSLRLARMARGEEQRDGLEGIHSPMLPCPVGMGGRSSRDGRDPTGGLRSGVRTCDARTGPAPGRRHPNATQVDWDDTIAI